eukprot:4635091-Pleurochrysis_carterae.AAC.1
MASQITIVIIAPTTTTACTANRSEARSRGIIGNKATTYQTAATAPGILAKCGIAFNVPIVPARAAASTAGAGAKYSPLDRKTPTNGKTVDNK